jgi:hypothetical protein
MTLSPSDWELLHREVDGETTDDESSGLRERLAAEAELREAYQALTGVGQALSSVRIEDPPPALASEVMRQVRRRGAPGGSRDWLAPMSAWVAGQPALALAATLAVGLLGGLLVTSLSERGLAPLDESAVSGTALPGEQQSALPILDRARLTGEGIEAVATIRRGRGAVVAEVEVAAPAPVDVTVIVEPTQLRPQGFECLGDEPAGGVVIEAGRVELREAGPGRCFVKMATLGTVTDPVVVQVVAGPDRVEAALRARTSEE